MDREVFDTDAIRFVVICGLWLVVLHEIHVSFIQQASNSGSLGAVP